MKKTTKPANTWEALQGMVAQAGKRRDPKPFPVTKTGGYPTRIMWMVTRDHRGKLKTIAYTGKPSRRAIMRFRAVMMDRNSNYFYAFEYDRGGIVSESHGECARGAFDPMASSLFATIYNSRLKHFYHPWTNVGVMFFPDFYDFGRKRLKLNGKVYVHYSKTSKQVLKTPEVMAFKRWYDSEWPPKPAPKMVDEGPFPAQYWAGADIDPNTGMIVPR